MHAVQKLTRSEPAGRGARRGVALTLALVLAGATAAGCGADERGASAAPLPDGAPSDDAGAAAAPNAAAANDAGPAAAGEADGWQRAPAPYRFGSFEASPVHVRPREGGGTDLPPNEYGRVPILMYHLVGDEEGRWARERGNFRRDLQLLYDRGYRPITVAELIDGHIDLPAGYSPVVFTFDDASPGQFSYLEKPDGTLEIDPGSAVGIWLDFQRQHPDWANKATFCMLSGAAAGRSFFGDRGIEGQKTAWRHRKVRWLAEQGFELCNHTLWHMNFSQYGDGPVQEQLARLQMAVDSAVPGYRIRTLALPLGIWPKNRELAFAGEWTDPKTGQTITYRNEAVLEVAGGSARSPFDPQFNPRSLPRVQVWQDELRRELDRIDRTRYVSAGPTQGRPLRGPE
jgi:hypothetical protein